MKHEPVAYSESRRTAFWAVATKEKHAGPAADMLHQHQVKSG